MTSVKIFGKKIGKKIALLVWPGHLFSQYPPWLGLKAVELL